MKVKLTFLEEVLGTMSNNPEIHREFIASKSPDAKTIEDEVASVGVDAIEEKQTTVFPRDTEGNPFIYDYQIKGFFKDSCGMLARVNGTESSKLTAYKKIIDGLVFVFPRQIPVSMPEGKPMSYCQRPLRGQTAQGERISLARSETMPAGTSIVIDIKTHDLKAKEGKGKVNLDTLIEELLAYGELRGLLQWRNSGKGRFSWVKC